MALENLAEDSGIAIEILQSLIINKINVPGKTSQEVKVEPVDEVDNVEPKKAQVFTEEPVKRSHRNTRRVRTSKHHKQHIWTNRRLDTSCFRDRALTLVDLDTYHDTMGEKHESLENLLKLSRITQRSQLDRFTYNERKFIAVVWLSVVRIFEYDHDRNAYFEAKRLPRRYIDPHTNLITSCLYDDEKLYIAYLNSDQPKKASIEIRDLKSELITEPYYYDQTVESIQSDKEFIYIKTVNNLIYLHRKKAFHLIRYCVDLSGITKDYILCARARIIRTSRFTKMDVLVSTTKRFLLLHLDAIKTSVVQNYLFDCQYETVSVHHADNLVITHRNVIHPYHSNKHKSKLEIGLITSGHSLFVHERTISFDYHIYQVELGHDATIYLFGRNASGRCEIGCMSTSDFSPVWSHRFADGLDHSAKIIIQDNHIVLYTQQNQKILCISTEGSKFNDCLMLKSTETQINVNMK